MHTNNNSHIIKNIIINININNNKNTFILPPHIINKNSLTHKNNTYAGDSLQRITITLIINIPQ
jgi:hypothetical protein